MGLRQQAGAQDVVVVVGNPEEKGEGGSLECLRGFEPLRLEQ